MKRRLFFKSMGGWTMGSGLFFLPPAVTAATGSAGAAGSGFPNGEQILALPEFRQAFNDVLKKARSGDGEPWKFLRRQFYLPEGFIYLNTGGLGSSPGVVIHRVLQAMAEEESNPEPGHNLEDWDKIKEKCGQLLGPGIKKEELALTGSATEGMNFILNGLPWQPGDEIITSTHEHVALNVPLLNLMKTRGIVIKTFVPDLDNGSGNVARIEQCITPRTRLIFISYITCTTGQVMPVTAIGELAGGKGLWFALDGVQVAGHMPCDLALSGADFFAGSGHKWLLGPKRTGFLFVRKNLLDTLQPTVMGAYSNESYDFNARRLVLFPTAQRYEYGTQNDALIYGLETALEFAICIGAGRVYGYTKQLAEMFYSRLLHLPQVTILSPSEVQYRSAVITFRIENKENLKLCDYLKKQRIRVRHVPEAGLDGVRVSFHMYNNEEEVETLLYEIKKVAG